MSVKKFLIGLGLLSIAGCAPAAGTAEADCVFFSQKHLELARAFTSCAENSQCQLTLKDYQKLEWSRERVKRHCEKSEDEL